MMEVENYTQNISDYSQFRNGGRGGCGIKRASGMISKRAYERLISEARRDYLDGFAIDFDLYGEPEAVFHDMIVAQITWQHKVTGKKIELTDIHFDRATGAIDQAGSNYGSLSF